MLIYLNDKERGRHYLLYNFSAAPMSPPPHSPDAAILVYLNNREGAPIFVVEF